MSRLGESSFRRARSSDSRSRCKSTTTKCPGQTTPSGPGGGGCLLRCDSAPTSRVALSSRLACNAPTLRQNVHLFAVGCTKPVDAPRPGKGRRRYLIFAGGVILLLAGSYLALCVFAGSFGGIIYAGGSLCRVELATSQKQWREGLGGRDRPEFPGGMLFLLPRADRPVFWMREMRFPLDLIWLHGGLVVAIDAQVPPPEAGVPLREYRPPSEIDAIWEAPAGTARRIGLQPGTRVRFLNFRHRLE